MFSRGLLIMIITLAMWQVGHAQVVFKTVEDAWKYADDHNVSIRIARYDASKAVLGKKQAYSVLMPSVSASGTYTDNMSLQTTLLPGIIVGKPDGTYIPVQFGQKYIYNAGITAQLDILNLQSWFNIQAAKISAQMSKDSLANTRKNIYQQIATQYYSVLLMTEAARLARESESISDSVLQSVTNKYNEGNVSKANVDVAKINLDRAQQTSITAQFQIQTAKNNLKALLDMTLADSLVIEDNLQRSAAGDASLTFTEDPAVKLAYDAMCISISQYKSVKSAFIPTLTASYSNSTQQNDNKFEPFSGGPAWYPAQFWSLRASWTIFNGGSRYYQARRSSIGVDQRRLQYESAQKQSEINDENLQLAYRKTRALLGKTEDVMNLSFDNYTHISNRYNSGLASIEERLNAFSDYIGYQNQYLNSLSDMLVQLYQVKIRQQKY